MTGNLDVYDFDSIPSGRPRAVLEKSNVKRGAIPRSNNLFEAVIRIEAFVKISDFSDRGNTQGANSHRIWLIPSFSYGVICAVIVGVAGKG